MTSIDSGDDNVSVSEDNATTTAAMELATQSTMDSAGPDIVDQNHHQPHDDVLRTDTGMAVATMNRRNSQPEEDQTESTQDSDLPTVDQQQDIEQQQEQPSSIPLSSAASVDVGDDAITTNTVEAATTAPPKPLSSYEPSAIRKKIMAKRRRSSRELARDTKRILEICYGGASDGSDGDGDPTVDQSKDNGESDDTGDNKEKKNKKNKTNNKKNTAKKKGSSGTSKKKAKTNVQGDSDQRQAEEDGSSSETVQSPDAGPVKKRKKKKKCNKKKTKSIDDGSADDEGDEGDGEGGVSSSTTKKRKKKPRKKKKKKSSNSTSSSSAKTKIKRDAAGRIIRKRRKIKDRHKVVKKEFIKKGKDAKINLETIVDDEDEYSSSSDDESFSSDSSSSSSDSDDEYGTENGIDEDLEGIGAWSDNDSDSDEDDDDDGDGVYAYDDEVARENDSPSDTSIGTVSQSVADESVEVTEKDLEMQSEDVAADSDVIKSTDVGSVASSNTDSSDDNVPANSKQRYNLFYFCRNRKLVYSAVLIAAVVAAVVVLVVLFAVDKEGKETEDITQPSYPPTPVEVTSNPTADTSSPTSFPTSEQATSSPTSYFEDVSTICQTLAGRPNVQFFEAEDSPRVGGNLTVGNETRGYCGNGYVTDFIDRRSRLVIADIEVETTGFYTFVLRYSTNKDYEDLDLEEDSLFDNSRIILDVNGSAVGSFDLIPTENSTTWTIDEIFDVLLKPGSHRLVLWSDEVLAWSDPNVDWLAVQFNRQATRFEYLSSILSPIFPELTEPSSTQIQALVWLSSDDPADWSEFDDQDLVERYLLVMFYFSTNGDLWLNNNEWLSALHVCDWYGVLCWEGMKVTDLFLDDNQLFGTIPSAEISQLSSLVSISAGSNSLEGTIGSEIGRLDRLERLLLDANFLTGPLPTSFSGLTNLKYLSLESNDLMGELPVEVFTLTNLDFFSIASNNINGTLPSDAIDGLDSIRELDVSKNAISGNIPTEIGQLTTLSSLSLASNLLSGSVPTELGLLIDLILLDISSNSLTGIWPPELDILLNDTVIDYYGNDVIE
mmetsp:Transcript_5865/g.14393  ORF Transcript_5865/g.14393 Transcript_5865/m.14393 type:complete len:1057 (+) Transcript_5865:280-3450(+)